MRCASKNKKTAAMSTSLFRLRIAAYLIATVFGNHGFFLFVIMECIKLPLRVGWAGGGDECTQN